MSVARVGRLRGLHLYVLRRHQHPTAVAAATATAIHPRQEQIRLINHYISNTPSLVWSDEPLETGKFTLAVKDNIATTSTSTTTSEPTSRSPSTSEDDDSFPTTCASDFLSTYRSPFEATVVKQLRARGAVVVGKTNLDEFGMGSHSTHSAFGPVAQEPNPDSGGTPKLLSAGGSSGGSAVAVAAREADVALGTDTGGSVRLPAAYTGIVGFKPSYGMLSRHGVVPYANSLDTVGLLARSVKPIAELIVGNGKDGKDGLWKEHDPKDPTSLSPAARRRCAAERKGYGSHSTALVGGGSEDLLPLTGIRFGLPLEYNIAELDPRIRDAWSDAAERLQKLGARVVPVSLPSTRHALSAYYIIAPAEASSNLAKYDGIRYGARESSSRSDPFSSDPFPSPSQPLLQEETTATESPAAEEGVLYAATRGSNFGPEVKRRILLGGYTLSSEAMDNYFLQAQRIRRLVRRDFDRVFRLSNPLLPESEQTFDLADLPDSVILENKFGPPEVDFLLCPTAPTLAPGLNELIEGGDGEGEGEGAGAGAVDAYVNDVFTVPASLAGLPAVSVPVKVQGSEQPAGLQVIGQYWDDARLLAAAALVSQALENK